MKLGNMHDSKSCAARLVGSSPTLGTMNNKKLNSDKELQAYVIGLALGDGNLSNNRGTTRLRITCDTKYPFLYKKILSSLKLLLPDNKVGIIDRGPNCLDISVYSNHLEKLLEWRAKEGSKFLQKASVPNWIKNNNQYKIACLRGLIETDGSIYNDRNYTMMTFKNIIPDLAKDFYNMVIDLGFKPHLYTIKPQNPDLHKFNQQTAYQVRLSKNVSKFLELVNPEKI